MTLPVQVRVVEASAMEALRPRLCELLIDSVRHGASVGFLDPLAPADADAFWRRVERAVVDGRCVLLVAARADGAVMGTVQLDVDTLPNQPHRGSVSKLLVHSTARRRGIGETLMVALERAAADAGRWLLTLDTATAQADRLYRRLGWTPAGEIPDYALNPDGTLTHTSLYWKRLAT
jgi:ribosomal protein S18 acetylase RimI-like enzyme